VPCSNLRWIDKWNKQIKLLSCLSEVTMPMSKMTSLIYALVEFTYNNFIITVILLLFFYINYDFYQKANKPAEVEPKDLASRVDAYWITFVNKKYKKNGKKT
jgi:hypothetical protein